MEASRNRDLHAGRIPTRRAKLGIVAGFVLSVVTLVGSIPLLAGSKDEHACVCLTSPSLKKYTDQGGSEKKAEEKDLAAATPAAARLVKSR